MSNLIEHNAYRIFGLDHNSNQKDILKRYKEIINRLKIDDHPEYDLDVGLPEDQRTEETVNESLKRLQQPKANIKEYFFWFRISDTVDEKALTQIKSGDYEKAILTWKRASGENNSTSFFYKRNLSILYCLLLSKEQNVSYLEESISNWHEIVNSDKFWVTFEKSYSINNDQTASSAMIAEFKKSVVKYISDVYTDLYQKNKNTKYIKCFQEVFGTHGEKAEKDLLKPMHQSIYDTIEELKKIDFSKEEPTDEGKKSEHICENCGDKQAKKYWSYDDGSLLCDKCRKQIGKQWQKKVDETDKTIEGSRKKVRQIEKLIAKLESQLDQLRKTGLYEDNQSKVVRDHVADAIRGVSIDIHNQIHMKNKSIELLKLSIKVAGTESVKEKYESDLKKIKEIAESDVKSSLVLEIPKFWSKKSITFMNDFVEYGDKKIYYKDVTTIFYHGIKNESTREYHFFVQSHNEKINLSFSNNDDLWNKLVNVAGQLIEPLIVKRLVKLIFEKGQTVTIGDLNIDQKGFHRQGRLFRSVEYVSWDSRIYLPKYSQGNVILFEEKEGVGKLFATIPMKEPNAVVLPELIKSCAEENAMRDQKVITWS